MFVQYYVFVISYLENVMLAPFLLGEMRGLGGKALMLFKINFPIHSLFLNFKFSQSPLFYNILPNENNTCSGQVNELLKAVKNKIDDRIKCFESI